MIGASYREVQMIVYTQKVSMKSALFVVYCGR